MNIRTYTDADFIRIMELHRQSKLNYLMPQMNTFFSKRVVEGDGDIGAAVFMRLNAEAMLICNPEWRNPAWRMEAIRQLHTVCEEDARVVGAQEGICFVPPPLANKFGGRLIEMGWSRVSEPQFVTFYKEL